MQLQIAQPVRAALEAGRPVVALESTILTHGLPRPINLEAALAIEEEIREEGATPATIAVIAGQIKVGLVPAELAVLAGRTDVLKASRKDLGAAVATGRWAGTTVAATMYVAHLAGIQVFATGGIGGVHRGAAASWDVSADLIELGRTPVAVVCAGAKAILDLPLTAEVLETQGVPLVGYGTDELPGFYTRSTGLPVDVRADDPAVAAAVMAEHWRLGGGGVLVANPIPEAFALPADQVEAQIAQALDEAARQGVRGKAVTPFLLAALERMSKGKTLESNLALVKNNARVASRIAAALKARESA